MYSHKNVVAQKFIMLQINFVYVFLSLFFSLSVCVSLYSRSDIVSPFFVTSFIRLVWFVSHRVCVVYCSSVGFITPFVSYVAVFKWFVISCWYLLFKFFSLSHEYSRVLLLLCVSFYCHRKTFIRIGIPCACERTPKKTQPTKRTHNVWNPNKYSSSWFWSVFQSHFFSFARRKSFVFQSFLWESHRSSHPNIVK